MKKLVILAFLTMLGSAVPTQVLAQQVIRLWSAKAPGSESDTVTEKSQPSEQGTRVSDVIDPTITVFLPEAAKATGTAMVIAPGGAMRVLQLPGADNEPVKWLLDRGIAAIVLKYRLIPSNSPLNGLPLSTLAGFPRGSANPFPDNAEFSRRMNMAYADAHQAIRVVRQNAKQWRIDPKKVGLLGYSAGGSVGFGAIVTPSDNGKPDFMISAYGPAVQELAVTKDAPPIFLAVRQYHPNVARALMAAYLEWTLAGAPAEMHVYNQMDSPFLPDVGEWLERAYVWMGELGFAPAMSEPTQTIVK